LQWLIERHGLANAERVMLTGVSAGAMAIFLWTDYVRSLLKHPEGLFAVIDSGIFLNEPSVRTGMLKLGVSFENLYKVANSDESTPLTACNEFYPGEEYKCFFI
jgi:O-palmitoleoyl-L-serine hydrolase